MLVAPVMNLKIRGGTDRSVDLEWEGSVMLTDFLVTYTPSSTGGKQKASSILHKKRHMNIDRLSFSPPHLCVRCPVRD